MTEPLPPKVCEECGAEYTPKPNNYAKAKRCPVCAKTRRSTGSAKRPSRDKNSDKNKRHKAKLEEQVKDRIENRRYIGIDGEGVNEPSHWRNEWWEEGDPVYTDHRYRFMSATAYGSDGRDRLGDLEPKPGQARLHTEDILRWLWSITRKTAEEREDKSLCPSLWFYGSKYDWTKIFTDIAIEDPDFLRDVFHPPVDDPFKVYWWRGWGISYVQASVKIMRRRWDKDKGEYVIVGTMFFQDGFKCWGGGSFVDQLKAWEVGTPEQRERIAGMKDQRAHFTEIDDQVREYCREEVDLLAELARKITIIASEMNIRPAGGVVYSAGSYAKAMLRRNRIPADPDNGWDGYRGEDRYAGAGDMIADMLRRSFFGGWFDLFETGHFDELHMIDLASAYPSVIRDLPCLSHGHWEEGRSDNPRALTFGHVEWEPKDATKNSKVGPFPWRYPNGRTYRPEIGEGWYVGELIDSARKLDRFDITELGWYSFVPDCDHEPFGWVQEVYDLRVSLGKDGRGLVLKVSLNSVYGTFADTLALDSRYASIVWAATITGRTQAKLLDVIADHYDDVVGVATDGIQAKRPLPVQAKPKTLGGWDSEGVIRDVLAVQPGLYLAREGESPKKMARSRGHALRDMRAIEDQLREAWEREGWAGEVSYNRNRFMPAKLALARKDIMGVYGQWVDETVTIKFRPSGRRALNTPGPTKPSVIHCDHMADPVIADSGDYCSRPYDKLVALELNQRLIDAKELDDAQPSQ